MCETVRKQPDPEGGTAVATEYEIISHGLTSYKIFFNNLLYRAPHVHKDYEICLVLSGGMKINYRDTSLSLAADDLFIVNPFQSHEFIAQQPTLLLILAALWVGSPIASHLVSRMEYLTDEDAKNHFREEDRT